MMYPSRAVQEALRRAMKFASSLLVETAALSNVGSVLRVAASQCKDGVVTSLGWGQVNALR